MALLAIDFDDPPFYDRWLSDVGLLADGLPTQQTGRGYQVWLRCDQPGRNDEFAYVPDGSKDDGRRIAIESRGEGGYAILPGSRHPSNRIYTAIAGNFLAIPKVPQADVDTLIRSARDLDEAPRTKQEMERAAKAKVRPRQSLMGQTSVIDSYNDRVSIHEALAAAGYTKRGTRYVRPGGKSQSVEIFDERRSFHFSSNDPLKSQHAHDAFDVYCHYRHAGDVSSAVKAAAEELGLPSSAVTVQGQQDDPDIIPLVDDDPPEIEPDVLPAWARDYAVELSQAKEVSPTMATMLELATMASCVQRAYKVRIEPSYLEPLCIYAAPAMPSGERKTAIHHPVVGPLFAFQAELRKAAAQQAKAVELTRRLCASQIKALERRHQSGGDPDVQAGIKKQIAELEAQMPPPVPIPQVIVEDFTEASLSIALANNDESLLVTSDEGGLFDNLSGRHNDISEIDLFLKAHAGSAHTVNRVGRDNLLLTRPLLSVAISPQPAILAKLAHKEGFIGRGLTARFLWALPKSRVGNRELRPAHIGQDVEAQYHSGIIALATEGYQHVGDPLLVHLSGEAYRAWKDFELVIEPRIGPKGDLFPIKAWASKLPGAVARIAAVCHCAAWAGQQPEHQPISQDQMVAAVRMGYQLISHAILVHRLMGAASLGTAESVVKHYSDVGWPEGQLSLTDWWRPVRRLVGESSRDFRAVAVALADHAYLIPVGETRSSGWGLVYRANRKLIRKSESPLGVF